MAVKGISAVAVAATFGGTVLIWSAVKGKGVSQVLQSLMHGKNPSNLPEQNPITGASGVMANTIPSADPSVTGSVIANDALQYLGGPYLWGGANPNSGADCSGFVNWVLSHDLGLPIPGLPHGGFTGQTHGPSTFTWVAWTGKNRVKRADVVAGDIVLWQTHMGIAISNTEYISAYDSQEGIVIHPIHGGGPIGEIGTFWRLKNQIGSGGTIPRAAYIPHKGRL